MYLDKLEISWLFEMRDIHLFWDKGSTWKIYITIQGQGMFRVCLVQLIIGEQFFYFSSKNSSTGTCETVLLSRLIKQFFMVNEKYKITI
jgi:hypothetical protein